jgi:hypothetical protein
MRRFRTAVTRLNPDAGGVAVPITIGSVEDLARLSRRSRTPVAVKLDVDIASLGEPRRREIERTLSRSLSACGCDEGAALGLLYLVVLVAFVIAGDGPRSMVQWGLAFVGLCGAAMVGKFAGIGIARMRLSRETQVLKEIILTQTVEKDAEK